jgi:ubiquinol-cytochrome c reductase cytochrome b subunit
VATLSFYAVLFLGGAADVLAATFDVSVNAVLWTFRIAVLAAPPVFGWVAYRLCKELAARDGVPTASKVQVRDIPRRLRHGKAATEGTDGTDGSGEASDASEPAGMA